MTVGGGELRVPAARACCKGGWCCSTQMGRWGLDWDPQDSSSAPGPGLQGETRHGGVFFLKTDSFTVNSNISLNAAWLCGW